VSKVRYEIGWFKDFRNVSAMTVGWKQDATLYNILYLLSMLCMFQAVSLPIIRSSKTLHTATGICQACLLLVPEWVSHSPTLAVASSKPGIYPMLCVVFELLMMGGEIA